MARVQFEIDDTLEEDIERMVEEGGFTTRTEFFKWQNQVSRSMLAAWKAGHSITGHKIADESDIFPGKVLTIPFDVLRPFPFRKFSTAHTP